MELKFKTRTYNINIKDTAKENIKKRNTDIHKVLSVIISLDEERLSQYINRDTNIFIIDEYESHIGVEFNIINGTINIINVLDSSDCYVKHGSNAIEFE